MRTVNGIIYLDMKTRGVYLELSLRVDEEHSTSLMIHPDPSKPERRCAQYRWPSCKAHNP